MKQKQPDYSNHLAGETSPYLLQHVHNPVEWYPWCDTALARARREQKPILLSIGYSACHWCHVMAHESFEDESTAELMNRLFINIKVDREERPDLDRIYQTAHSILTRRSGGWPLTVFLTPDDQVPFFAGTYFPNRPRHGLIAFDDLLVRVSEFLQEHADEVRRQNSALVSALETGPGTGTAQALSATPLDSARRALEREFDAVNGGFGEAPKFPHPGNIERLLRHWQHSTGLGPAPDRRALHMAMFTLEHMARGGVFDQLGGGFYRYSVDGQWMIPHFEKMLYDNGPMLALYSEAFAISGNSLFRRVAEQTAAWVIREMQADTGGYYSSLDADSEGEEGRFYSWTPDEARAVLDEGDYALVAARYGLDRDANFEGRWHLHVYRTTRQLADQFDSTAAAVDTSLAASHRRLFEAREHRVRPGRDEKILTSWNGLMIRGMAIAGRLLDEPGWIASADRALEFIRSSLWRDGRLLATSKDGKAHLNAYLDDYVYLADAILELLQSRWRSADLDFAIELADAVLVHFADPAGGFYFTSADHERLIHRPKPTHDDSMPAGNGIAARMLNRLGHLLGESRYLEAAEATLQAGWQAITGMPHGHCSTLTALEEMLFPLQTVIIRGNDAAQVSAWHSLVSSVYAPARLAHAIPSTAGTLPGALAARTTDRLVAAWVCSGNTCSTPVHDRETFRSHMRDRTEHTR